MNLGATCAACELTLLEACQRSAVLLCGLCRLLRPEDLRRYAARWRLAESRAIARRGDAQ